MNIKARNLINTIADRALAYSKHVSSIFSEYEEDMSQVKRDSANYKPEYAQKLVEEKRQQFAKATKAALKRDCDTFREKTAEDIEKVRDMLLDVLAKPVPSILLNHLDVYQRYGISPSKSQIDTLLTLNQGSQLGLMAIQSVLKKNGSPYSISFIGVDQFEQDLDRLEKLAFDADHLVPLENFHAGCEVYKDDKVTIRRADGSEYNDGSNWDRIALNARQGEFFALAESLSEMANNWCDGVTNASINEASEKFIAEEKATAEENGEEFDDPTPTPTTSVEESGSGAIELARQLGRESGGGAPLSERLSNYIR